MIKLKKLNKEPDFKEIMTEIYGDCKVYDTSHEIAEFKKFMLPLMKRVYPGLYYTKR